MFQILDKWTISDTVTGKKNCQVLWGSVFKNSDQFLSFFCLTTYPRVPYTDSPVWVLAFWFCKGSVKRTDGNNLWLTSNPDDCCFYSLDFLWCQRCRSSPELPHVTWNCCQHFIAFSISGFLIANSSIKDSHALYIFQSSFSFFPSTEGCWALPKQHRDFKLDVSRPH